MSKRTAIVLAMWGAALGAMAIILVSQPEEPEPARQPEEGAPIRVAGRDEAPDEPRAHLPTWQPEPGPPRSYRNDRRHTGRSPWEGPSSSELVWSFETEGRISAQAVVAPDGTIYVGSHDGHLHALSPHGTEKWKRDLQDRVYATPHVGADGNVYVGSDADSFWSFTPAGDLRWRLATEGDADTGTAQAPDGTLHFGAGDHLWAVRPDGTVKWRFEAREKIYTTPAVDDDGTVYVGSQDDHLYAVAADGRMRWAYETGGDVDSSPAIGDDGSVLFGSDDEHLYALSRDGVLTWSTDLDGYVRAPPALGRDGSVVIGVYGPRPRVVSLDARSGDVRWYFPVTVADNSEIGVQSGALVDAEGNIYVGAHDDYLYALAPNGELRWIFEARGDVDAPPVLTEDGTLLVGADDGHLYAIRAAIP